MFEAYDFYYIMERLLSKVSEDYDTREGSVIWDALAPVAMELSDFYVCLDMIVEESFADTASYYYLIKRAAERGLYPNEATKAILKGEIHPTTLVLETGTRFNLNDLNYIVIGKREDGSYLLECETEGILGNSQKGVLLPIEYVEGLERAELTEVLIPGKEEEDVEDFRERYFASFDSQAFGGNIADYKKKVNALPGVGGCKVYPVWNGGGTVKVVIISSEWKVPTADLVTLVQTALDPEQNHGEGVGLAPIGHTVTVEGVTASMVTFDFDIIYLSGYGFENLESAIREVVEEYLTTIIKDWDTVTAIIVRRSQIEARLLTITGIVDVLKTKINGKEENLILSGNEIPIAGEIYG